MISNDDIDDLQVSLGFCCCGNPEDNLKYVRNGLHHINEMHNMDDDKMSFEEWTEKGLEIFGSRKAEYFFYYWADKEGLTEHGGSVPGWLDTKGHELLENLNIILEDK